MKRIVTILLAVVMLVSALAVTTSARGYTLTIPETVSSHNLEAYGLHTMNVYSTTVPPSVDGVVSTAEYPGPNNGLSLESVPGDNLWMNAYYPKSDGTQNSLYPECDWTDYIDRADMPDYIHTYLTYDDDYLYFAVSTVIPAIRNTSATDNIAGATRSPLWFFGTRLNFMQSDNIALAQGGNSSSFARNIYNLYKYPVGNDFSEGQTAQSVTINKRIYTLYEDEKFNTVTLGTYVDEFGQTWGSSVYKRAENFTYKVTVLSDGKWGVVFEGRQPLGDILRITDIEYEDGSPIDYVPEWGAWGIEIRLQASVAKTSTLPNGNEVSIRPDDTIFAQTFLPAGGAANSGANGVIRYVDANGKPGSYLLHNTIGAAVKAGHGKGTVSTSFWMNPVHFLGKYDPNFNYEGFYSTPTDTVLTTTSRVTRTRGALTSAVRGAATVNNRVAAASTAAVATGDNLTMTIVLSVSMILCAAAATLIVVKRRGSRNH